MLKAIDVANFFIDIANNNDDDCITNLRVNKLLYFAQGWSLARKNKPLFEEEIQAWKYGPVVPSVYQAFKPCGRNNISEPSGEYSADIFTNDELELLIDVLREYGKYSGPALVDLTHKKNSPWEQVYLPESKSTIISKEKLKDYFLQEQSLHSFDLNNISENDFVGYRDAKDGLLVLPQEYDDAE